LIVDADLPTVLESRDDGPNESTLKMKLVFFPPPIFITAVAYLNAVRLDGNEAINKN
jgi:hypothetical protein